MRGVVDSKAGPGEAGQSRVRLDKWLWAARFYKTRSQATEAIHGGHVKNEAGRLKAGHSVSIGERIEITKESVLWEVVVMGLSEKRGSGAAAQLLYRETDEGKARRIAQAEALRAAQQAAPYLKGRPTKRDRRAMDRFVAGDPDE
jgi:ribosome-associated heat shock protein Hsp15